MLGIFNLRQAEAYLKAQATPKTLKEAIRNALEEIKEQGVTDLDKQIEIIHMHVQDKMAQDFNTAMLTHNDCESLWNRIFKAGK